MNVYVLSCTNRDEQEKILGTYLTLELAQQARPGEWKLATEETVDLWSLHSRRQRRFGDPLEANFMYVESYLIYELELEFPVDVDPFTAFAILLLKKDPMAMDGLRDILRC